MQPWTGPKLPIAPDKGPALRLFDSASGGLKESTPGPLARMYVCGITPYDATHMGHAATYVTFDLINRYWRDRGHDVRYTQNVTDIDDPLLERAVATGTDWREIAERETQLFRTDMEALRVLAPNDYIGAVESIPSVARYIEKLIAIGAVYEVDGDLYFDVHSDPNFGSVSRLEESEMIRIFAERGGDPERPGKRHPLDCLLWLAARPDEPAWDTPLGHGRPGWHIECVAIALDTLGMGFDVQGGGRDLLFPHHDMGASEAHVLTGTHPYADIYVHGGMVGLDGEKMSKSKGNLVFVSRLRQAGRDPMAIRLALLAHHYRTDWEWTEQGLIDAENRLATWRLAAQRTSAPDAATAIGAIRAHLANDLNAPSALTAVDDWCSAEGDSQSGASELAVAIDALLGVSL